VLGFNCSATAGGRLTDKLTLRQPTIRRPRHNKCLELLTISNKLSQTHQLTRLRCCSMVTRAAARRIWLSHICVVQFIIYHLNREESGSERSTAGLPKEGGDRRVFSGCLISDRGATACGCEDQTFRVNSSFHSRRNDPPSC